MSATEIAAWWGAITATLVFVWDIYKWIHAGSKIDVSASPNMQTYGGMPAEMEDSTYIVVTVNNSGDQATTLTHLLGYHYPTLFHRIFRKRKNTFVVVNPAMTGSFPHVLKPGEQWLGGIEQTSELEELSRNGHLYCGIHHSSSKKAIVAKLIVPE